MNEPVLLVLAAGMGSRFGGLKQIEPIGPAGEIILDYTLYDAMRAGFKKAVFVVRKETLDDFRAVAGKRAEKYMQVDYVFQSLEDLPEGFSVPEGRTKPWGTGHAVLCGMSAIDSPFAVVNADDFYGRDCFVKLYEFLTGKCSESNMAMVGYRLSNTLSEHGGVSRGICETSDGLLKSITERKGIKKTAEGIVYDDMAAGAYLAEDDIASMNVFAMDKSVFPKLKAGFEAFLRGGCTDPLKSEYYIPSFVDSLIEGGIRFNVLGTTAEWLGVTFREDKQPVSAALAELHAGGEYPVQLP